MTVRESEALGDAGVAVGPADGDEDGEGEVVGNGGAEAQANGGIVA